MSELGNAETQREHEEQQFNDLSDSFLNSPVAGDNLDGPHGDQTLTSGIEIRQIAGLTAGTVLPLDRGSFHFRNGGSEIQFSLHIETRSRVMVVPGKGFLRINDEDLDGPTRLGNGILDVGNARFIVRQRSSERRLSGDELLTESQPIIAVPPLDGSLIEPPAIQTPEPPAPDKKKGGLFGAFSTGRWADGSDQDHPVIPNTPQASPTEAPRGVLGGFTSGRWAESSSASLDGASWEFMEEIRDVRREQADQYRAVHPHPEETMHRLKRGGTGLWNREPHHSLFGRVAIAYADLAWAPLFDNPDAIPVRLRPHIAGISTLPSVPVTANLPIGPLGIFGHRASALAVARQALLAIATTSRPESFEFGVFANDEFVEDWEWVNNLPENFFSSSRNSQAFVFADGEHGYRRAGELHPIAQREAGVVVVSETVDSLPADCGTVIQVDEYGYCRVTNHLGEMIDATPLGVTEEFAEQMSQTISTVLS